MAGGDDPRENPAPSRSSCARRGVIDLATDGDRLVVRSPPWESTQGSRREEGQGRLDGWRREDGRRAELLVKAPGGYRPCGSELTERVSKQGCEADHCAPGNARRWRARIRMREALDVTVWLTCVAPARRDSQKFRARMSLSQVLNEYGTAEVHPSAGCLETDEKPRSVIRLINAVLKRARLMSPTCYKNQPL